MKLNLDFYSSEKEENISEEEKNIYEKYFSEIKILKFNQIRKLLIIKY